MLRALRVAAAVLLAADSAAAAAFRALPPLRLSLAPGAPLGVRIAPAGGAPRLTPAALPSLRPSLGAGLPSYFRVEAAARPAEAAPAALAEPAAGPRADFFFNDHDASRSYRKALREFALSHDEVLVESLREGEHRAVFQSVADGKRTPAEALALLSERAEPMDAAVLEALHLSGVRVLAEPIYAAGRRAERLRIDKELLPQASERLSAAHASFLDDGDARAAADELKAFNALMVEIHALREAALVEELTRRLSAGGSSIGVIFGSFHTQPYHALRRAGFAAGRSFHPPALGGSVRSAPYVRPLRRLRFGRPYRDAEAEDKDSLATLVFWTFLDKLYKKDRFAAEQAQVYDAILARMRFADLEELTREVSAAYAEARPGRDGERPMARVMLAWLEDQGFLKPQERAYFGR